MVKWKLILRLALHFATKNSINKLILKNQFSADQSSVLFIAHLLTWEFKSFLTTHAFSVYGSEINQQNKPKNPVKLVVEFHVKIYFSTLSRSMTSIKNFNINFTNLKLSTSWMKVQDIRMKHKWALCFQTKKRNPNQDLIMLIIKIIESGVVSITLLVMRSLIIIAKDAAAKQEDSVFLNVNVHKLARLEREVVHAKEKMIAETRSAIVSKTIKNVFQVCVKDASIARV